MNYPTLERETISIEADCMNIQTTYRSLFTVVSLLVVLLTNVEPSEERFRLLSERV
jgi:hypothetical protein